ncbi:MAG: NAD(P)H-binding protein [Rhizobacter sp.]
MYVLLGSSGQITSQLARRLLAAGHPVRVVGRQGGALAALREAGAQTAIGDPSDAAFLERAFAGATAVYTMTPPCYGEPDMHAAQSHIGEAVVEALARARVRRVVNLSSIGAELPAGTGPIVGLHDQEQRLNALAGTEVLHLRPGSFMENTFAALATLAAGEPLMGMEAADVPIPMVATRDIAAVAAHELVTPRHTGVLLLHAARHATMREVAGAIGAATGRPDLPYVQVPAADMKAALRAEGFSADSADQLEQLARWLSTGGVASIAAGPALEQPTRLEDFAREVFAPAFAQAVGASVPTAAAASLR